MKISELMTSPAIDIGPRASIQEAALRMDALLVGSLLVCEEERLCGIVTDRDLAVRALARGLEPQTPVSEVMSAPVVTVDADADLALAYRVFRCNAVRRLPVLGRRGPAGMLTVDDLLRETAQRLTDLLGPISWSALREEPPHSRRGAALNSRRGPGQ
jgi:signal-transduction protein with cAMP-binding, CBS, and nucleotidyltransferase domain